MSIKTSIWFFIHNHRRNLLVGRFARLCKNIHRASEHPGYDFNRNGERAVLRRCATNEAAVLFDVGANLGNWTEMARQVCPKSVIHSFELNPKTAALLAQRYSGIQQIQVHPFGLASASGQVDFYAYDGEASVLSGTRVPLHSHVPHRIQSAKVRTGDEVCREWGVPSIDYLKIDAEGGDFDVLSGFADMLARHKISLIQFEHEGGRYLRDFYDFLGPKGYSIGKLYANYVDFCEHNADLEHFLGPNYIAIPNSRVDLIHALKKGLLA